MVVFARDDEAGRPTAVVIDKFCDGYTLGESWNKTGVRGCHACDVLFRDIVLEESDILGSRGQGFNILLENIAFGKMGFCAESVGSSQECLDQSILYARTKTNRNLPIARFESMQLRLSDMAVKVEAARWLTYRLGYLADHRDGSFSFAAEAALTKRFVAEAFVDVAREAVQAHGSYGVIADFRVEMAYRDAIVGEIVEGTKDLQRRIIAGNLLN